MTIVVLLAMTFGFGLGLQGSGVNNGSFAQPGVWVDPANLLIGAPFMLFACPVAVVVGALYARRKVPWLVGTIAYPVGAVIVSTLIAVAFIHAGGQVQLGGF